MWSLTCVYLHLLTKLSQSRHIVYRVQPIVMVYTPQNRCYTPWYAESTNFGDLAIIFIGLACMISRVLYNNTVNNFTLHTTHYILISTHVWHMYSLVCYLVSCVDDSEVSTVILNNWRGFLFQTNRPWPRVTLGNRQLSQYTLRTRWILSTHLVSIIYTD